MTLNAYSNLIFKASSMHNLNCLTCGRPMMPTLIEPLNKGFELRHYHCFKCDITEAFVTEL